jgi:hypothetical protein
MPKCQQKTAVAKTAVIKTAVIKIRNATQGVPYN